MIWQELYKFKSFQMKMKKKGFHKFESKVYIFPTAFCEIIQFSIVIYAPYECLQLVPLHRDKEFTFMHFYRLFIALFLKLT